VKHPMCLAPILIRLAAELGIRIAVKELLMPVSRAAAAPVVASPAVANDASDFEVLQRLLGDNAAATDQLLGLFTRLVASHGDLLEIVDGICQELATLSAEVAEIRADRRDTFPRPAQGTDEVEQALRQAAALAQRAAAILERVHRSEPEPSVPVQLHSASG
jgi:hypothetical protein